MSLCAVVLAAGEGRRLRPLTDHVPKALCPVGNVPLLDRALRRLAALGLTGPDAVAVNACYLGEQVVKHLGDRVHLSVEPPPPLGTSGGLGKLRDWIDGRDVLVCNADAYLTPEPTPAYADLVDRWDGATVRLLGIPAEPDRAEFDGHRFAGASLLPWRWVEPLEPVFGELVRTVWRPAEAAGELEVVPHHGSFFDCGTPRDYLMANLHAAAHSNGSGAVAAYPRSLVGPDATVTGRIGQAVVGAGARIEGEVTRCVVWPGGVVGPDEHLSDAIRVGSSLTVPALG